MVKFCFLSDLNSDSFHLVNNFHFTKFPLVIHNNFCVNIYSFDTLISLALTTVITNLALKNKTFENSDIVGDDGMRLIMQK